MRFYSRKGIKSDRERIFNYRLSRARRIIENAFGILTSRFINRWRVLCSCICMKPENVEKIVLATLCLHNFLIMREDCENERKIYCPTSYVDYEDHDGSVIPGMWRNETTNSNFHNIGCLGCNSATRNAVTQRNALADWMISEEGQVSWQTQMIHRANHVNFPCLTQR
ncbi:hypothetical protein ALC60_10230 [Trachymyrmex zeteki]|uniref:DDE Tnp4 domain-containing protein n=1 Tax=Mycetomoellerius zeteki TaxID=64791 RepID=A0A151WSB8_9HYME|nr:hypothetical protein ALC60_10230 [Trachymyrmex zeteki]